MYEEIIYHRDHYLGSHDDAAFECMGAAVCTGEYPNRLHNQAQHTSAAKTPQASTANSARHLVLKTQKDKVSYALGMNMGTNLHKAVG